MRNSFINKLEEICHKDKNVFLLTGDLGFKLFDSFRKTHSDKFLNMGIAETNMIGVSAGLALSGKKVYCYSIIPFLIMRCFEHIRVDICYHALDVKLIGVGGGLVYGLEGATHHAVEDIALMRSIPGISIVVPADPYEASKCIEESYRYKGPMFIRLGKTGEPPVYDSPPDFKIGKGCYVSRHGEDACILANGNMVHRAKMASQLLLQKGLKITVISMHTVKPIDRELVLSCLDRFRFIFTVEEHSVVGGLGTAVSEIMAETRNNTYFKRMGIPDSYKDEIGSGDYLYEKYGLTTAKIAETVEKTINQV